jgi:hypothetical protein
VQTPVSLLCPVSSTEDCLEPNVRTLPLPIVIARWFKGGAGYAFSKEVDAKLLMTTIEALAPVSHHNGDRAFRLNLPDGRLLIGEKKADQQPLDPDAERRHPYIIRAAICPHELNQEQQAEVIRQMVDLAVPVNSGMASNLLVELLLPSQRRQIPLSTPKSSMSGWLPWLIAATLIGIDISLWASDLYDDSLGVKIRSVILLALACLVTLFSMYGGSVSQLHAMVQEAEWQWYIDADPIEAHVVRFESDARIVMPDGGIVEPETSGSIRSLGIKRQQESDITYWRAEIHGSSVILTGTESIVYRKVKQEAVFTRIYNIDQDCRLSYAQWSPILHHANYRSTI